MILIASKEEKELIQRLRTLGPTPEATELTAQLIKLRREVAEAEITKAKQKEDFDRQDRELRHMIGLEKKRQEVEITQAKRDTELTVREGNLKADQKRFEEQLKFNTQRFESMEKYLKDAFESVLGRLPQVNVDVQRKAR